MPVMTPAHGASSSYMPSAASCDSSRNGVPGSSSSCDALARQQLAARDVLGARGLAAAERDLRDLHVQVADQRAHRLGVGLELRVAGIEVAFDLVQASLPCGAVRARRTAPMCVAPTHCITSWVY